MDWKKSEVPFLEEDKIKKEADKFREKYWGGDIPVNMEYIIEIELKFNICPEYQLIEKCDTDALFCPVGNVLVDYKRFKEEKYRKRLRFSLAHEIGHFVLHNNFFSRIEAEDENQLTEAYIKFIQQIPKKDYNWLEYQANSFAGKLLLPTEKLLKQKKKEIKKIKEHTSLDSNQIKEETLNSYIARPIAKKFGVSTDPAKIELNKV